jgi:LmbE family N-acetylglucosaminyl deacetylase/PKD repeat protein
MKQTVRAGLGTAIAVVLFVSPLWSPLLAVSAATVPTGKILIVSAHPDDDVLIAAGISSASTNVTIAYLTNGESCCYETVPTIGDIRQDEAVDAQVNHLNRVEDDLIFFGYPSRKLTDMLNSPGTLIPGFTGRTVTFAHSGLGRTDYHNNWAGSHAPYTGNNLVADLTHLVDNLRPDHIFTTGMFDRHVDHKGAYRAVVDAVTDVNGSDSSYTPTLHSTIVHVVPQPYWGKWPATNSAGPSPDLFHVPVPELDLTTGGTLKWSGRESYVVSTAMQNTTLAQNPKYQAIEEHETQLDNANGGDTWIRTFARRDEVFWSEVLPNSSTPSKGVGDTYVDLVGQGGQATVPAIGVLGNDIAGNLAKAMSAVKTSNPTNGSVSFNSDGSFTYTHNGSMAGSDSFTYKPQQGSVLGAEATVNITIALPNQGPTADAGGPYVATAGATTQFDGSGSTDPDGTINSYEWDFGDGSTGAGVGPSHTYTTSGTFDVELTVADNDADSDDDQTSATVSDAPIPGPRHGVGLVDPNQGSWHLYDDDGIEATSFFFGNPGDYPFMGDWDGDGVETPGLYRQADGFVYLTNSNAQGLADIRFFFGNPGDVPIAGDFNNDGKDTVSIYRPAEARFYIINELGSNDGGLGAADIDYVFGNIGDKPFVGDFDGDGVETVGLHRESTGLVYYINVHAKGQNAANQFVFGDPGDRLVAGDWTGDGMFSPGLFRPSTTTMFFKHDNTQGNADSQFVPVPTASGWIPVSGLR